MPPSGEFNSHQKDGGVSSELAGDFSVVIAGLLRSIEILKFPRDLSLFCDTRAGELNVENFMCQSGSSVRSRFSPR